MNKYDFTKLIEELKKWNIELTDNQLDQFLKYYELLIEWNEKFNLTAITEFDEVVSKHFIDSLSLINTYDLNSSVSLIDIGTGAGFPGIPIKIAFPNVNVVLLDSLQKRVTFLNEVIKECNLDNITAIHGRAEDYGQNSEYREKFDLAVSRAVANLSSLTEICLPFVKKDGLFISYKSIKSDEEIESCNNTFKLLSCEIEEIFRFSLFNSDRCFIKIKRNGELSDKYPRRAGIPIKKPLG